MTKDTVGEVFVGALLGFILLLLIALGCEADSKTSLLEEALERGHAEYIIVDPIKGTTEWRWKEHDGCQETNVVNTAEE